jgi:hypothetical protein
MPEVFAAIGPVAIPALSAYLTDSSHDIYPRTTAADCLTTIGKKYPDAKPDIKFYSSLRTTAIEEDSFWFRLENIVPIKH